MNSGRWLIAASILSGAFLLSGCGRESLDEVPVAVPETWKHLVKTEGQAYPIPEVWLSTPEGKIAHSLKLPDSVPKPVPFDFEKAGAHRFWEKKPNVALKYFDHLCETEAGEWIFKKVENVEGLYFARPGNQPSDDYLGDLYAPEAPWVERNFQLMGESADDRGRYFVGPPFRNYSFVEEPRRDAKWQQGIEEPYIRLFGYTYKKVVNPSYYGKPQLKNLWFDLRENTPMQVIGIPEPTARYGYTWRGITRPRDREHYIAGGEVMIYDRKTREIFAVSRIFQITRKNPRRPFGASWMVSPTCGGDVGRLVGLRLSEFSARVLIAVPLNDPDLSWVNKK